MSVSRCRHTFTEEKCYIPWQRCNLCLLAIVPFSDVRYCSNCGCYLHNPCYRSILNQLQRITTNMEESAGETVEGAPEVNLEATPAAGTGHEPTPAVPEPLLKERSWTDDVSSFMTEQRDALLSKFTASFADRGLAEKNHLSFYGSAGSEEGEAGPASLAEGAGETGISSNSKKEAFTAQPASAVASGCQVHELVPIEFVMPTRCECCYRHLKMPQREELLSNLHLERNTAHIAKLKSISNSYMAFGAEGYLCRKCGINIHRPCVVCIPYYKVQKNDSGEEAVKPYIVVNPDPHSMSPDNDPKNTTKNSNANGNGSFSLKSPITSGENFMSNLRLLFAQSKLGSKSVYPVEDKGLSRPSSSSSSFFSVFGQNDPWVLSKVKTFVNTYFDAGNTKYDNSMKVVVCRLQGLLALVVARHPALLWSSTFNVLKLHTISKEQEILYMVGSNSLPDADILFDQQQSPLSNKPDSVKNDSCSAAEGSSASSYLFTEEKKVGNISTTTTKTPTIQGSPMLLALRDAVRYAIAAYGENYRNGNLSSLVKATMLFTVQRESTMQIPDEVNNKAVTEVLALPASALRASHWAKKANEPSYTLVVDSLSSRIVVAFRGTLTDTDILTDVCALGLPFCGGVAHQGAALAVNYLFERRASTLSKAEKSKNEKRNGEEEEEQPPPTKHVDPVPTMESMELDPIKADEEAAKENPENISEDPTAPYTLPPLTAEEEASLAPDYLLDTLQTVAETYRDYDILITGHSLGGGLAVLFGVRLQYDRTFPPQIHDRIRVVAYAAMPTLSLPAASGFGEPRDPNRPSEKRDGQEEGASSMVPIWNLVNGCDIVPRLQINSIDRLCALLTKGAAASDEECEMTDMKKSEQEEASGARPEDEVREVSVVVSTGDADADGSNGPAAVEATVNTTNTSAAQKERELVQRPDLTSELHHPGRVFMTTAPWDPNLNRLVEVPRGHIIMHEIMLMRPMLELHLIDSYSAGLRYVKSQEEVDKYVAGRKK